VCVRAPCGPDSKQPLWKAANFRCSTVPIIVRFSVFFSLRDVDRRPVPACLAVVTQCRQFLEIIFSSGSVLDWRGMWHVWDSGAYRVLVRRPE
jgi:hypothetical protein